MERKIGKSEREKENGRYIAEENREVPYSVLGIFKYYYYDYYNDCGCIEVT